jgi:hypothetical protein
MFTHFMNRNTAITRTTTNPNPVNGMKALSVL